MENCRNPPGFRIRQASRSATCDCGISMRRVPEWQPLRAGGGVKHARGARLFVLPRMADEGGRDVDRVHARAALGELARIVSLAAAKVQARQAVHIRQEIEESGGIQQVAIDIEASAA